LGINVFIFHFARDSSVTNLFVCSKAQNENTTKKKREHTMQPVSSAKGASFSLLRYSFSNNNAKCSERGWPKQLRLPSHFL